MSREGEGRRIRVAVIFGGRSVEHEISIITALQLIRALDTERYDPIPVYIAQSGRWYTGPTLLEKATYLALPGSLSSLTEVTLHPRPEVGGLTPTQMRPVGSGVGALPLLAFLAAISVIGFPLGLALGVMAFLKLNAHGGTSQDRRLTNWALGLSMA